MTYTSFEFFVIYFGATFLLYTIAPIKYKKYALLLGSAFFYFVATRGHIFALIASALLTWGAALLIQKQNDEFAAKKKLVEKSERKALKAKYNKRKGLICTAGVILNLGILLVLKYSNFFVSTFGAIFKFDAPELHFIQPLGISFYTLQAVSYIVDVNRGKYKAGKNPIDIFIYLSFMLTIVEGPVARYDQLGTQLVKGERLSFKNLQMGYQLIVWGLFKKVVIADRAAEFVNNVFDNTGKYTGVVVIAGILFYTLQLYCEFSGVMDVVTGMGELMGIKLPENFNRPFFAKSINEFWQRWHITLGAFLRDYIFYSISLSKPFMKLTKSARKRFNPYYANLIPTAFALFFVWFANGFWHGSGWKYIVYGLYYYVLMMLALFMEPLFAKICKALKINREAKPYALFQMLRTFLIVNIGMLIFRADGLRAAFRMLISIPQLNLAALKPGSGNGLGLDLKDYGILVVGTGVIFLVSLLREKGVDIREKVYRMPFVVKFVGYLAAALLIIVIGAYGDNYGVVDLIYANF